MALFLQSVAEQVSRPRARAPSVPVGTHQWAPAGAGAGARGGGGGVDLPRETTSTHCRSNSQMGEVNSTGHHCKGECKAGDSARGEKGTIGGCTRHAFFMDRHQGRTKIRRDPKSGMTRKDSSGFGHAPRIKRSLQEHTTSTPQGSPRSGSQTPSSNLRDLEQCKRCFRHRVSLWGDPTMRRVRYGTTAVA